MIEIIILSIFFLIFCTYFYLKNKKLGEALQQRDGSIFSLEEIKNKNLVVLAKLETELAAAKERNIFLEKIELENKNKEIQDLTEEKNKYLVLSTKMQAEVNAAKEHCLFLEKTQKESIEASKDFFKSIAQEILDEKSIKISDHNKKNLSEILNPLKERLSSFEQIVWRTNKEDAERVTALKKEITILSEISNKINTEAHNLTRAIKGDSKQQGIWGEFILESILEKSGLVQDREYFIQKSHNSEDGKMQRPDVIIKLPNERSLIIDSKVSLKNYEQFFNAENEIMQKEELKKHLASIRNHIKELKLKEYQKLYNFEGIDFVFLFIPIESVFSITIQSDPDIFSFAYDKNIILVSPSTLLATMRTVNNIWQNETRNMFAMEIARQAGEMYDKLVSFVEDLKKIGQRIEQSQSQYNDAMSKLSSGKGNLVTRAENMKKLGAKASKQLDKNLQIFE